ncbi:flagellar basal body-associated FliL family protein [Geodermatophilus sp. DF01-2]|uniref:flagellar basal body-associated FliL family protein n=1 Tax=Geodermatophilus sp. DF01-2 TaxID=2559610 RepID=UPI0010733016|nr:flagellar basal body-associated FliL family protein [Geodermatophilus sp. DF01_2]TFV54374.1 flagellar basal body-associated FliL family protein [Geodermatophilus sp. DF01_2]
MADKKRKAETPEDDEATDGGRKKLLVVGLAAVLALAGAAYFFLFAGSSEAEAAAPEHGGYVALEPIAVNLAGGGYLKIGITLEITADAAGGGHGGASVDGAKALDLLISTYSQAQPADVTGARDALKESLEQKIIEAYTEHGTQMVMGIYLTEYVTQ